MTTVAFRASRVLFGALLGLSGLAACAGGAAGGAELSSASQGADAAAAPTSANPADGGADVGASCARFAVTDCSAGQIVAIAQALDGAEIDAANLALGRTSSSDVNAFATRMIIDHTDLERQLRAWLDAAGISPLESDVSRELSASAAAELASLRQSSQLDRDYAAREVVDHVTALGFFEHVLPLGADLASAVGAASAQPGSDAALAQLLAGARATIRTHLRLAFALEQSVAGACGTPGATCSDAGAADAGELDAAATLR